MGLKRCKLSPLKQNTLYFPIRNWCSTHYRSHQHLVMNSQPGSWGSSHLPKYLKIWPRKIRVWNMDPDIAQLRNMISFPVHSYRLFDWLVGTLPRQIHSNAMNCLRICWYVLVSQISFALLFYVFYIGWCHTQTPWKWNLKGNQWRWMINMEATNGTKSFPSIK